MSFISPKVLFTVWFLIYNVFCIPRDFFSSNMCVPNGIGDCSFQITNRKENICQVYNTAVCKSFNFSSWSSAPIRYPSRESDTSYTVSVLPYGLMFKREQTSPLSAININIGSANQEINGFVLHVNGYQRNINICRIFDIRNAAVKQRNNVSLFYDCIYSLLNEGNFQLVVRALPLNEEIKYNIFVPDVHEIEPSDVCQWKPLIMVFLQSLASNVVEVKFLQAPRHLNVSAYEVAILAENHDQEKTVFDAALVHSDSKTDFLRSVFLNVDRGYYSVNIKPIVRKYSCNGATNQVFFIENKMIDSVMIGSICGMILIGIILIAIILVFLRWLFKPGHVLHKPVVLLVYSYDSKNHEAVVKRYTKFLQCQCGIKVTSIYGTGNDDPNKWLRRHYDEANVIMIVISAGVFHKAEKRNCPPMQENHTWGDRLTPALSFLMREMFSSEKKVSEKKFVKIFFEYSGEQHVPDCLRTRSSGEVFSLPKQTNRLLCYLYDQLPKLNCLNVYPRMPGHDVVSTPEGMALIESIEDMKQSVQLDLKETGTTLRNGRPPVFKWEAKLDDEKAKPVPQKITLSDSSPCKSNVIYKHNEDPYARLICENTDSFQNVPQTSAKYPLCLKDTVMEDDFWKSILSKEFKDTFQNNSGISRNDDLDEKDGMWDNILSNIEFNNRQHNKNNN